jgi:hypothetical protein
VAAADGWARLRQSSARSWFPKVGEEGRRPMSAVAAERVGDLGLGVGGTGLRQVLGFSVPNRGEASDANGLFGLHLMKSCF